MRVAWLHRQRPCFASATRRRAMAQIPYDPDNVFKKILEGQVPCYKVFETEHAMAFLDAFPVARGHCLLVPKQTGYATVMDMPEDVAADVLKELPRLARAVMRASGADGVNIVQNNGKAAGQVVFHVHFHVVPRFDGDRAVHMNAPSRDMIQPEIAQGVLADLQQHL
mmetsp:Transcript_3307/g.20607  ORF Transcript_3307/g.20607 Transcript_3307/m.20607 type:complete len:167 (-) Transcript_3307:149-649(-)